MDDLRAQSNIVFSIIATNMVSILGGWDFSLKLLVMLVIFDYVTGIMKALYGRRLSSSIGFWGIFKKLCIFFVVACASQIDLLIVQNAPVIRTLVIYFYISNEGISMLENLSDLGVPVPDVIRDRLLKFNQKGADTK